MVQPRIPDRLYMTGYRSPPCGDGPNQHTERTPIFRLKYVATRGAQNGARLGYRAVLHGEFALCALDGRFWLLGGFLKKNNFPVRRGMPSVFLFLNVAVRSPSRFACFGSALINSEL